MKKTFNINLGGQIFHIDDDAFNKLEAYLGALRQQFSSTSGGDEILNDVETRMAELFKERTANTKEVINIQDVDEAIAIIGKPEDFWHEDEASKSNFQYDNTMSYQKRVMRDVDNRVLGGVASGLAAYFNIDTLWIRLLFVALMFAGFGVLLYIILWLVVPAARTTTEKLHVHKPCQRAMLGPNLVRHVIDRFSDTNIAAMSNHFSAMRAHQLFSRFFANAATPTTNMNLGAKFQKSFGHLFSETRTAAGNQDALSRHQTIAEHKLTDIHTHLSRVLFSLREV